MLPCITITIHEAIHPNSGALPCRDSALSSDHAASFSSRAATCIGRVAAYGRRVGGGRPRAVVVWRMCARALLYISGIMTVRCRPDRSCGAARRPCGSGRSGQNILICLKGPAAGNRVRGRISTRLRQREASLRVRLFFAFAAGTRWQRRPGNGPLWSFLSCSRRPQRKVRPQEWPPWIVALPTLARR